VDALALKLVLTPLLIGAASLAGRRWGPWLSGWLVGFPFTSGPIVLFLALGLGTRFAAASAAGTLIGTFSQAVFCLAYSRSAVGRRWWRSVVVGSLAFAALTLVFGRLSLPLLIASVIVFAAIVLSLLLMPSARAADAPTVQPPWWDIPARMVIATGGGAAVYGDNLTRMRAAGLIAADADPHALALSTFAALHGGLLLTQTMQSVEPLEAALDGALAALRSKAPTPRRRARRVIPPDARLA
jgi:hypothetical protein